jgi:cell shape-determining protein MreC
MPRNIFFKQLLKVVSMLAIFAVLIIWNPQKFFSPFREIFARTNYAFQKIFSTMGDNTKGFFDFLGSISKLKNENEDLIKENNLLFSQLIQFFPN